VAEQARGLGEGRVGTCCRAAIDCEPLDHNCTSGLRSTIGRAP
jgi:hypothetical protein